MSIQEAVEAKENHTDYDDDVIINKALLCLEKRLRYGSHIFTCAKAVCDYLRLQLGDEKNEVFAVLFLDSKHSLVAFEKLFFGTINQSAIYLRVVVQKSLEHNASAIIIAHNHPSEQCAPSDADKVITEDLKKILNLVDVKLLDHIIVSHKECYSFTHHQLL